MNYINVNGKLQLADEPALFVSNRAYRYGDGLFETMKFHNDEILLSSFHFERFFAGLSKLKFQVPEFFTAEKLESEILQLCKKNNCTQLARVRLSAFRGNGGLYDGDKSLQYIIECWPLQESVNKLNENGLLIGVYTEVNKNTDEFSNLKLANFLPYTMAALYAKENKWNDCLVLNTNGHIADATVANVFIIKRGEIYTPALTEGCINGVMRRYLLEEFQKSGYIVHETAFSINNVEIADEVFLTNAINGIRWVKQFRNKIYTNIKTVEIYNRVFPTNQ